MNENINVLVSAVEQARNEIKKNKQISMAGIKQIIEENVLSLVDKSPYYGNLPLYREVMGFYRLLNKEDNSSGASMYLDNLLDRYRN